jgi:hypothetical protein
MASMRNDLDILSLRAIVLGWSLAATCLLLAPVAAVIGQGLGAWIGGCQWIGVSLPLGRQVWALVNQPTLAFATSASAFGYWLGSLALPLGLSLVLGIFFSRTRSLNSELLTVHVVWAFAVIDGAWMPLLDTSDGHLGRWLHFADITEHLVWAAPLMATALGAVAALRLLAVTRVSRPQAGRLLRLGVVAFHLVVPTGVVVIASSILIGKALPAPTIAIAMVCAASLAMAWLRYPPAHVYSLREITGADMLRAVVALIVVANVVWLAGRPLGEDRVAGLLWSRARTNNNIRPWIDARSLLPRAISANQH